MGRTSQQSIFYVDRRSGERRQERVVAEWALRAVYTMPLLHPFLRGIFTHAAYQAATGLYFRSAASRGDIPGFIAQHHIVMEDFVEERYRSFNDFFIRRLKGGSRSIPTDPGVIVSPCDGKVFCVPAVGPDYLFAIKGREYNILTLLGGDKALAKTFVGGPLYIFRLAPFDYHRFHFPVGGTPQATRSLPGKLDSVSPIALAARAGILAENKRDLTLIATPQLGNVAMIEIGAMGVASIVQTFTPAQVIARGQEKGYFQMGGSSIALLFPPHVMRPDADILKHTKEGFETTILQGESIGAKI